MPTGRLPKAITRACRACGKKYVSDAIIRHYCNDLCRKHSYLERFQIRSCTPQELRGNPIGTAAEMLVCFDLERRGLDVFRALSPASRHDLIACERRNGVDTLYRIEVKNARKWKPVASTGEERVTYGGNNINTTADIMALAITSTPPEVFYFKPKSGSMFRIADQYRFWEKH
jgi:hypothetical protein